MKRCLAVLIMLLLLCGCMPVAQEGSVETKTGTVVDLAMSSGLPYVGVEFQDGSGDCFYGLEKNIIPDDVAIGDQVELTYGFDEHTNRWFIIELCEIG